MLSEENGHRPGREMFCWRFFSLAVMLVAIPVMGDVKATERTSAASETIIYDIPAQALDSALDRYIKLSGAQVFYETSIAAGRRSTEVKGRFDAAAALRTMLLGTGLVSRQTDADAFMIGAAEEGAGTSQTAVALDSQFLGALQGRILGALCGHSQTRPGRYKIAFELWVSPNGVIQRIELIGSTRDAARDAALANVLQGVHIGTAPPAEVQQPFVMTIAPHAPSEADDCAAR